MKNDNAEAVSLNLSRPIGDGRTRLDLMRTEPVYSEIPWISSQRSGFNYPRIHTDPSDPESTPQVALTRIVT